jgi:FixJ family two-component response regulator
MNVSGGAIRNKFACVMYACAWRTLVEPQNCIVFIVDDDQWIRESISDLLLSCDIQSVAFGSAAEYLAYSKPDLSACLVLDVQLPDINGLDLQSQILPGVQPHIVFITGHGDIPSSVQAIKAGAVDFLTKPFRDSDLISAVNLALARNSETRRQSATLADAHWLLETLTPREREMLPLIVSGLLNKQIAAELGISGFTVQIHRGKIMDKMRVASLADLVRLAAMLEIPIAYSRHPSHS